MNILFVCTANVSRSYAAEKLFYHEAAQSGLEGVAVSSAGVMDMTDAPPDPKMADYLEKAGVAGRDHASRRMCGEYTEWADLIL